MNHAETSFLPPKRARKPPGLHVEYRKTLGKTLKEMTQTERTEYSRLQSFSYAHRNSKTMPTPKKRNSANYGTWAVRINHNLRDRVLNAAAALDQFDVTEITENSFTLYINALERQFNGGEPFPHRPRKEDV